MNKRRPHFFCIALGLLVIGLTAFWPASNLAPLGPTPLVAAGPSGDPVQPVSPAAPAGVMLGASPAAAPGRAREFDRFDDWLSRYFAAPAADRDVLLAEGRALAVERRGVLAQLIRQDPRAALAAAVPMVARQQLPAEIVAQLEDRVTGRGELVHLAITPAPGRPVEESSYRLAVIDGIEYRAHVFGRRDLAGSVAKTSINGIALDGHLAVAESPLRVLEAGEVAASRPVDAVCGVSGVETPTGPASPLNTAAGGPTAVEYDGAVHILCGANHLAQTEGRLLAREESNVAAAGGATAVDVAGRPTYEWTHGPKKLLVIRVDFSDRPGGPSNVQGTPLTDDDVVNATSGVQSFYENASFGQTSLVLGLATNGDSPDVSPVLRVPQPSSYYDGSGATDRSWQLHVDARAAAQAAGIDVASYDRVCVVFAPLNFFWSGLGEIGGRNFWINAPYSFHVVTHELGHTYGMMHSNAWRVSDGNPISPAGTSLEYGDEFDIMGGGSDPSKEPSQWNKSILQWIPDAAVATATTSGLYRIYRLDHPAADLSLPHALKIRRTDQQDYWIGYRAGVPNPNLQNGAYILWGYHTNQQGNLLDLHPATVNNTYDAALLVGETFTDAGAGITIRPLAHGGMGAGQWLDVQVDLAPSVRWAQTGEWNVGEQDGQAVLRVVREGDAAAAISVNYSTTDGLAASPADFTAQTGALTWAAGDTADKFISIPIQSDTLWEAGERFTVTLGSPAGAVITGNAAATVAILDAGIRDFGWTSDWILHRVEKVLMQPDGSMIIGGIFQQIYDDRNTAYTRQGFAKLTAEGHLDPTYAQAGGISGGDNQVHALAQQPGGRVIVGGSFGFVQNAAHANLARLLTDGSVDPAFTAGTNGTVWSTVALPDGRILIAGMFTSVNGVPREYVARLNADGSLDNTFVGPDFDGTQGRWVRGLAVQADGNIVAGGAFALPSQGYLRAGLCRLLPNGTLDPTFVVREGASGSAGEVRTVAVQPDGKILIGGDFSSFNAVARGSLVRLNADGSVDASFVPALDGRCDAVLGLPDGRLVAGGWFFTANGTAIRNLALFQASGALDTNMASAGGSSGEVFEIQVVPNGRIQFCGDDQNFEHSQEGRSVWRMISGLANRPGLVQLGAATAHAGEGGSVTLSVTRTGGSGGAIAVGYATAPGTATSADFQPTTGTLTWAEGDASIKTITVPLTSDGVTDANETFTVGLGTPVLGGASLGAVVQATVTIDDNATPPPPPPATDWQTGDIGNVGAAGSSTESGGTITLSGAGEDIWNRADAFHYRSQSLTGDGAIIVRVASMGNTNPWAKVGVMFREDLTPGSREVMAFITPSNQSGILYRLAPGAEAAAGPIVWSGMPVWLMLARAGDTFGAYRSDDGNEWTQIGTINCDLPDTAYVGLAISSHVAGTTLTATLDHLEVIGVQSPPPSDPPPAAPSHFTSTDVTATTATLTWIDNSSDETGFVIERAPGFGGTFVEVATVAANSRAYTDTGLTANTTYSYRARAQRGTVYSGYSESALVTTGSQPPSSWQGLDIGNVGPGGSQTITDQNITVRAGGEDIWFAADGFRFVYQAWHGDGEIKARVAALTNTHPWAKAGLMFRETLAANSRHVAYVLTADNTSGLVARATTGADDTFAPGAWVNAPYWIRLVRSGDLFTASISPDGVTWTVQSSQTVAMGADVYVGVATCAHTTTQITTAAFEYVQLPTGTPPPPPPPPPTGDWTQTNLGSGSGSFTTPDAQSVTVNAAGADIWGQFDDGQFIQQPWSGDGQIIVRLDSLTNTHAWAKAGVMYRENLTATSRNIFLGLTPSAGVAFQVRDAAGGTTTEVRHDWAPNAPCWLRLTRSINTFAAAYSADGTNWVSLGSTDMATMPYDLYVGLGVSSHATTATTAAFSHIQLPTDAPRTGWQQKAWGSATGSFTKSGGTPGSNEPLNLEVTATGADIWNATDDGLYVYVPWVSTDGDGEISTRVESMTNTHPWAKAGLMFRAGVEADAANLFLALTPGVGVTLQVRSAAGVVTTEAQHSWQPGVPCWLRLTRFHDNTVRAEFSNDGMNWTLLGTVADSLPDANGFAGVGVSSHAAAATNVRFTAVQLSPAI